MNDGALVLDITGTILYINRQALSLLKLQSNPTGKKYATVFLDTDQQNDAFHQMILDAVYHKERPQTKVVPWYTEKQKQMFRLTSSFLQNEEGGESIGVVVLFSDVTEVETLNRQRRESSVIFATMIFSVAAYLFFWSTMLWLQLDIPLWCLTWIVLFLSAVMFWIAIKNTSFSIQDIGLRLINARATLRTDILITLAGAVLLLGGKLFLLRVAPGFFPAGAPFWDWSVGNVSDLYYPIAVVLQEFFAQCVVLGNLQRILTGKHARGLALLTSSMLFGVMHIAYGLPYMIGASLMLGALGTLYSKQGHIWGICIIHYVLGTMAIFLRYVV